MKRGDIYFATLDPVVGAEIRKTRPVLVVSNNAANKAASVVSVLPLSSQVARVFPFEVLLRAADTGLSKDSKAMAQQIRTLDKRRLASVRAGIVGVEQMQKIDSALRLQLQL